MIEDQENREIEHNRLFWDIKWIWRFENWEFKFDDWVRKDGIATINGKQYKKYEDNMNELWYSTWQDKWEFWWDGDSYSYLFLWKFENWKREGEWTIYFTNGDVYQWFFKDWKVNWRWIYTWSNWNRYEWNWVDGKSMGTWKYETKDYSLVWEFDQVNKKITAGVQTFKDWWVVLQWDFLGEEYPFDKWNVFLNGNNYIVERDDKWLKITSGPKENIGKYIDEDSWTIVSWDQLSWVVITSDSGESSNNVVWAKVNGTPQRKPEQAVNNGRNVPSNRPQAPEVKDKEWVLRYGLRSHPVILSRARRKALGIWANQELYIKDGKRDTFYYKTRTENDFDIFCAVSLNTPFIKTQYTWYKTWEKSNMFSSGVKHLNCCDEWVSKLNTLAPQDMKVFKFQNTNGLWELYYFTYKNKVYNLELGDLSGDVTGSFASILNSIDFAQKYLRAKTHGRENSRLTISNNSIVYKR